MRCQDAERHSLPVPCHEERTLPTARRTQYGTQDRGRDRAHPAGGDQAWLLHGGRAAAPTGSIGIETVATAVAVGTGIADRPRTDPYVQSCRIRLLPKVRDAKKRSSGYGCRTRHGGTYLRVRRLNRAQLSRCRWLRRNRACRQARHTSSRKPSNRRRFVGTAWYAK